MQYAAGAYGPPPPSSVGPPTAAAVLSIVGGALVLLGGFSELAEAVYAPTLTLGLFGGTLLVYGLVGILLGASLVVLGILVHTHSSHHVVLGTLIVVFSVLSLVSYGGGFLIGFVLGLVGGILALAWRPLTAPVYYPTPPPILRVCPRCGRVLDPTARFCPHCGNALS